MKILKPVTEHEVTALLFKYNYSSFRFGEKLKAIIKERGINKNIIINPNTQNEKENIIREKLMRSFDGDDIGGYLSQDFPNNVQWKLVRINKQEIQQIKYLNYSYWNELSNHKRYIAEGVKTIKKGVEIFSQSNDIFFKAFEALKQGAKFPPPVLIAKNEQSDLVAVDGHLRLTCYLLDSKYTPKEIDAYIGYSENFANWDLY
ncbi:MAG TPA: hypothetical protein P5232_00120 [Candidatus Moranbacteria bacterium]|nr:hypothetical protein [Candidatus Moranbacteria bacterium]